jgi:fibro-slime domain-containing protein
VFRDFNASHPDFQPPGTSEGQTGLVEERLDADGKPVYSGAANGNIQSAASFVEWYRDSASSSTVVDSLILWQNEDGGYVNRYGANGEQYLHVDFDTLAWCGPAGSNCSDPQCADANYPTCFDPCTPWNQPESACGGAILTFDGNPLFFPLDGAPEALLDPEGRFTAQIPPEYGGNWDTEEGAPLHDFHFTTEVRYWFKYEAAASATLDFTGDDDVWVFVNGVLALDLGGWHPPLSGSLTLDSASASRFGLVDGSVYQIAVFHAERQTNGSSFRLTLSGFNMAPSDCTTACGDGQLAPGEECDDGVALNTGDYNMCSPACTLGPRCGDGITQEQFGEACDNGVNDGAYGECAPNCQIGPHCGDGIVQPEKEQCDDGINDGGYGECAEHCVLGPYCGDGTLNLPEEECDDGNNEDFDTCSAACRDEIIML